MFRRLNLFTPHFLAGILILIAFHTARNAVSGLTWPCEADLYRDMGSAQAFIDGQWIGDPSYKGEIRWYNPLVPGLLAIGTQLFAGTYDFPTIAARIGPYLNIFSPLSFYLFCVVLFGPWVGVSSLCAYLFFGDYNEASLLHATYSPWFWPINFTQSLFFMTMSAYAMAIKKKKVLWSRMTGLLLGLTFLSHTAPAVMAALVVLFYTVDSYLRSKDPHEKKSLLLQLTTIGSISFFISLPFLLPIALRYGFQIKNWIPASFALIDGNHAFYSFMEIEAIFALAGAYSLWLGNGQARSSTRNLILLILLVCLLLLLHGIVAQSLRAKMNIHIFQFVPAFHFLLYMKSIEWILFGVGLERTMHILFQKLRSEDYAAGCAPQFSAAIALVIALLFVTPLNTSYDFTYFVHQGKMLSAQQERDRLYRWIIQYTLPSDVILADDDVTLYALLPAGRKVVALQGMYSNPYVSFDERVADQLYAYSSIETENSESFNHLRDKYEIKYVIYDEKSRFICCKKPRHISKLLLPLTTIGRYSVYRAETRKLGNSKT